MVDQDATVKSKWILFVAKRYFRSKQKDRNLAPSALSVLGIAVGIMTLVSVMAVMNGFQLGFIEDILEISSYHIRITEGQDLLSQEDVEDIEAIGQVEAVLPFIDIQTLSQGIYPEFEATLIRGVPEDAPRRDPDLVEQLTLIEGSFNVTELGSIVLGKELALELGVGVGETLSLTSLGGQSFEGLSPQQRQFTVTGIFKCGYYDFDRRLAFISLKDAALLKTGGSGLIYGIKITNRFQDKDIVRKITETLEDNSFSVVSWREFNRSFFGALRTEKLIMMVLIGLIFIVVAVNIYHSLNRSVYERLEEISLLRAIGASPLAVRVVFILDGLFIGITGSLIGLSLGLVISMNINAVFSLVEYMVNIASTLLLKIIAPLVASSSEHFSLFSPQYYYLTEVPAKVLLPETVFIVLFAVLSAGGAAHFASKKVSEIRPAEVLHYE